MQKESQQAVLDRLVRNETAACNTYRSIVGRVNSESHRKLLSVCCEDHERALTLLQGGGQPSPSEAQSEVPGWKHFQLIVDDAADPSEDPTAIEALSAGEVQCQLDYEQALGTEILDESIEKKVKSELLPAIRTHREILTRLLHEIHEP